jgi:hypothetical protein
LDLLKNGTERSWHKMKEFFCLGSSEEINKIKEQSIIALGEIYARQQ